MIQNCNVCERYREKPIRASRETTKSLQTFRVEMSGPFAVTGVDFSGPVTPGWRSLLLPKLHCIIYLYQHPRSTPEVVSWSLVCWISKSPKGVYCQVRMPSDPYKWQWKTCGYRQLVVYPQEGSQSWKLHWSSITWKFNLAQPCGGRFLRAPHWYHEEGTFKGGRPRPSDPIQRWKIFWLTLRDVWTIDHFFIRERNLNNRCLPQIPY